MAGYLCIMLPSGRRMDREFHLGDIEGLQDGLEIGMNVVELQADCDELELIQSQFTNIPMHRGRCVRWFGDMARFIFTNLKDQEKGTF